MKMPVANYQWHEFFPENGNMICPVLIMILSIQYIYGYIGISSHSASFTETHNILIVIAIWAPIILVS